VELRGVGVCGMRAGMCYKVGSMGVGVCGGVHVRECVCVWAGGGVAKGPVSAA